MASSERTEAPTLRRGMLSEVRTALGDLFGGKLDPKQELHIQVLFGLLGAVARSDWLVSSEEAQYTNVLMDELALNTAARKLATEAFSRGCKRELDAASEIRLFVQTFPKGSSEVERLYEHLLRLAAADSRIRPGERTLLEQITLELGYSKPEMEARLTRILHA
ncbi:MAG TPA: TerB family tellurite resistance protein [Rudaea sp.]|nr:TerB family tellurite resistance protein [Rudaea sp.]